MLKIIGFTTFYNYVTQDCHYNSPCFRAVILTCGFHLRITFKYPLIIKPHPPAPIKSEHLGVKHTSVIIISLW